VEQFTTRTGKQFVTAVRTLSSGWYSVRISAFASFGHTHSGAFLDQRLISDVALVAALSDVAYVTGQVTQVPQNVTHITDRAADRK
jgi:hypothetical protein